MTLNRKITEKICQDTWLSCGKYKTNYVISVLISSIIFSKLKKSNKWSTCRPFFGWERVSEKGQTTTLEENNIVDILQTTSCEEIAEMHSLRQWCLKQWFPTNWGSAVFKDAVQGLQPIISISCSLCILNHLGLYVTSWEWSYEPK